MKFLKTLFVFLFVYEKDRYYSLGSFRFPVKITQEFWDEAQHRNKFFKSQLKSAWPMADTTYGTGGEDFEKEIGKRPVVPTWIKDLRWLILCIASCISLIIMILIFAKS